MLFFAVVGKLRPRIVFLFLGRRRSSSAVLLVLVVRRRADAGAILGERPLWIAILNSLKLGLIYGLFVEAFKLGS